MKMSAKYLYGAAILTALLQTGVLFAGIEKRAQILRHGQDIVVQTSRVDPRDLMRGDYVILAYDFSTIDKGLIEGLTDNYSGDVYVVLKKADDTFWHVNRASVKFFDNLGENEVQLKGEPAYPIWLQPSGNVGLRFGIERYYVPEGEGLAIEGEISENNITAMIAISKTGIPQIKALQNKGEKIYEEPLY
ncbi:GDYXXLXY domain-containing protein [Brucellaceae bacterium C25G]